MRSTANDFWIMIIQENVRYIVMLCNAVENGKKKCHTYYPTKLGDKVEFDGNSDNYHFNLWTQQFATFIKTQK